MNDDEVVEGAQGDQVMQGGGPTRRAGDEVVDVAHAGGLFAAGEGAVGVAGGDGTAQVSWDGRFSLGHDVSVQGNLDYEGEIRSGGHYGFSTHNGNIRVAVPAKVSADVSVATFNGNFESSFPVQLTRTGHGKRFRFVLGSGSAELELESFQGAIRLRRVGEAP